MLSGLLRWILQHFVQTIAVAAGLVVVTTAIVSPQWWGDRAFGVIIGVAITVLFVAGLAVIDNYSDITIRGTSVAIILLIVPVGTALILRRRSGQGGVQLPIQVSFPVLPSSQSILLVLVACGFLILLVALGRSLSRGETVSIESHWGGLGGGIGGWRATTPLIYLLGIVFLILISCAVAWRVFPLGPDAPGQQSPTPASGSANPKPSPSVSPNP